MTAWLRQHSRVTAAAGLVVLVGLVMVAMVQHMAALHADGVSIGGPFNLVDGSGGRKSSADFRGRFMLIYFGYTRCPDACPTMLSDLAAALDQLPAKERAQVAPIFVTVDPARDTPAVIGDYARAFGDDFVGLTGSQAQITKAEAAYHVYAAKHPLKNGDYAMDHSSILYVMGPDGAFRGVVQDAKPGVMAAQMQALGV